jgi:DNA-binding NtrC family response regulator
MSAQSGFIAVVDDEPDLLEFYEEELKSGHRVQTFDNPQKFLDFLQALQDPSQAPDLLISDYKMPGQNGLTMIQSAQKLGFYFPFILLSGFLTKDVIMGAIGAGVFRVLEKPVDPQLLHHTIDELLMEHEIGKARAEIRKLTGQLREIYAGIRLIMDQYIPEDVQSRMIIETEGAGDVKQKMSFDEVLSTLEARLDFLLKKEQIFVDLKSKKGSDA